MQSAAFSPSREERWPVSPDGDSVEVKCTMHRLDGQRVLVEIASMNSPTGVVWWDVGHIAWVSRSDILSYGKAGTYLQCRFEGTDGEKVVVRLPDGQVVATPITQL